MPAILITPSVARRGGMPLAWRVVLIALLLAFEKLVLNLLLDSDAAQAATGLGAYVRDAQHWGLSCMATLTVALALFSYAQGNARVNAVNTLARSTPVNMELLALHATLFVPLAALTYSLYGNHGYSAPLPLLAAGWLLLAAAALVALLTAMAPWRTWREAVLALGHLWLYAAAVAIVAASALQWTQILWDPTTRITFRLVEQVLRPLLPSLHGNAVNQVVDTGHYALQISYLCSGLDGAGLLLAFGGAWLLYFRRDYAFPRALIVIPVGLAVLFALNIARIAALVLIGAAGYPAIASLGFNTQVSWFAFNCIVAAILFLSRRIAWLNRVPARSGRQNVT